MRGKDRLALADIVQSYRPDPQIQKNPSELNKVSKDLNTLLNYAHSPFSRLANDLRKKIATRQRMLKVCEKQAFLVRECFNNQPKANYQLTSNIVKLSSPPLIIKQQKAKIMNELKLNFLESKGVTNEEWRRFLRPDIGALEVSVPGVNAEVLIGLLQGTGYQLDWVVFDASIGGQKSVELHQLMKVLVKWGQSRQDQWKQELISEIKRILSNLRPVMLFLEFYSCYKSNQPFNISEQGLFKIDGIVGQTEWEWTFNFFESKGLPLFELTINKQLVFSLLFDGQQLIGELILGDKDGPAGELRFVIKEMVVISLEQLTQLVITIPKLQMNLTRFYEKYPQLDISNCCFFPRILRATWSLEGSTQKVPNVEAEGLWLLVAVEQGCLLQVKQDGTLQSKIWDKSTIGEVLSKKMKLQDLCRHLRLYEQMIAHNKEFQFKIFQTRVEQDNSKQKVVYEMRSSRYHSNHKYPIISKNQDRYTALDNSHYQNCVLVIKIPFDFTRVLFTSWKISDKDKNESDRKDFLPADWVSYYQNVKPGHPLQWRRVFHAIGYYCRCYLVERVRMRVLSEEDRKANSIEFK